MRDSRLGPPSRMHMPRTVSRSVRALQTIPGDLSINRSSEHSWRVVARASARDRVVVAIEAFESEGRRTQSENHHHCKCGAQRLHLHHFLPPSLSRHRSVGERELGTPERLLQCENALAAPAEATTLPSSSPVEDRTKADHDASTRAHPVSNDRLLSTRLAGRVGASRQSDALGARSRRGHLLVSEGVALLPHFKPTSSCCACHAKC